MNQTGRRRLGAGGTALTMILLLSGPALWAQEETANPALARAKELYMGLQYDDAIISLDRAMTRRGNTRSDLIEIFRLRGLVLASLGDDEESYQSFAKLLALDPEFKLPSDLSPRIGVPFEKAKAWWQEKGPMALEHDVPTGAHVEEQLPLALRVRSDPLRMIAGARLYYRTSGDQDYSTVEVRGEGHFQLTVPKLFLPAEAAGRSLEYFLMVTDEHGGELITLGGAEAPYRVNLSVRPKRPVATPVTVVDKPTPWYATWWFWTAVGGAVLAGTITGVSVAAVSGGGSEPPETVRYDVTVGVK